MNGLRHFAFSLLSFLINSTRRKKSWRSWFGFQYYSRYTTALGSYLEYYLTNERRWSMTDTNIKKNFCLLSPI